MSSHSHVPPAPAPTDRLSVSAVACCGRFIRTAPSPSLRAAGAEVSRWGSLSRLRLWTSAVSPCCHPSPCVNWNGGRCARVVGGTSRPRGREVRWLPCWAGGTVETRIQVFGFLLGSPPRHLSRLLSGPAHRTTGIGRTHPVCHALGATERICHCLVRVRALCTTQDEARRKAC